jgi:hypothetical protein
MSSSNVSSQMNKILEPYLFQVIGSTPTSVRDSIKLASLKNNPAVAVNLATVCVFAAAVNKVTLENFITKPEMGDARPAITSAFSISGKTNMTAITLLGHCLLTTTVMDGVSFVKEFRHKMGQSDIWDGDLSKGSLSTKQKDILSEKKRVTDLTDAKLLGSGFFKYTGLDTTTWTSAELTFWKEAALKPVTRTDKPLPFETSPPRQPRSFTVKQPTPVQASSSQSNSIPDIKEFVFSDGSKHFLSEAAVDFYMNLEGSDQTALEASALRRGDSAFSELYYTAATKGIAAASTTAASTYGGAR